MFAPLPELIDPWRAASRRDCYQGHCDLVGLERLNELLIEPVGRVDYKIHFERDHQRRSIVRLSIEAVLRLECQRCLAPLDWPVRAESLLALVSGLDEAAALPDDYDPLLTPALTKDRLLRPVELIEDELLLAVPTVPRHQACALATGRGPAWSRAPLVARKAAADSDLNASFALDGSSGVCSGRDSREYSSATDPFVQGSERPRADSPFALLSGWRTGSGSKAGGRG